MNTSKHVAVVLAAGMLAAAPGCRMRSSAPVAKQAREARTAADHASVARAYREGAQQLCDEAQQVANTADWAASHGDRPFAESEGDPRYEDEARHCQLVAADLTKAAEDMEALARIHEGVVAARAGTATKPSEHHAATGVEQTSRSKPGVTDLERRLFDAYAAEVSRVD